MPKGYELALKEGTVFGAKGQKSEHFAKPENGFIHIMSTSLVTGSGFTACHRQYFCIPKNELGQMVAWDLITLPFV